MAAGCRMIVIEDSHAPENTFRHSGGRPALPDGLRFRGHERRIQPLFQRFSLQLPHERERQTGRGDVQRLDRGFRVGPGHHRYQRHKVRALPVRSRFHERQHRAHGRFRFDPRCPSDRSPGKSRRAFRIKVPRNAILDRLVSSNGAIRTNDGTGPSRFHTSNGQIGCMD